jgi:RHS repeat-associated protein
MGTTTWSYDSAGRISEVAAPAGTVGYAYDSAGQRRQMTLPAGPVDYAYDAAGRVTSVTDWTGATTSFGYDDDGRQTLVERPNGVDSEYEYDVAGRPTGITHDAPDGTPLEDFAYTLDAAGNRTSLTSSVGVEDYTLDELDRLTRVEYANGDVVTYAYDAAGNLVSRTLNGATTTHAYDAAGQLASATGPDGTVSYAYDGAGNLVEAGVDTFTYDWANQLVGATVDGMSHAYAYDADGVRTDADAAPQVWDRLAGLPELVDDGENAYLHSPDGASVLVQYDGTDPSYLLPDALGSTRLVTDAAGAATGSTAYDAFGATRSANGSTSQFGFAGELLDPTGLIHLRARQYDPVVARFTAADSLQPNGFGTQGWNPYSYAANNPATFLDPTGRFAEQAATYQPSASLAPYIALLGFTVAYTFSLVFVQVCVIDGPCFGGLPIDNPDDRTTVDRPTAPRDTGGRSRENRGGDGGGGGGGGGGLAGTIPDAWQVGSFSEAIKSALAAAGIATGVLTLREGMPVYRVYGGCAPADGRSWTPINPVVIDQFLGSGTYRDLAGLPECNSGTALATGRLSLEALAIGAAETILAPGLDENQGGLPEIRFLTRQEVRAFVRQRHSIPASPPF